MLALQPCQNACAVSMQPWLFLVHTKAIHWGRPRAKCIKAVLSSHSMRCRVWKARPSGLASTRSSLERVSAASPAPCRRQCSSVPSRPCCTVLPGISLCVERPCGCADEDHRMGNSFDGEQAQLLLPPMSALVPEHFSPVYFVQVNFRCFGRMQHQAALLLSVDQSS